MCHPDVPLGQATPDVDRSEVTLAVGGEEMPALRTRPAAGLGPGVVIIGDFFGARTPFYENLAALLAASGCHALLPEYFFRQGPLSERTKPAAFERRQRLDDVQAIGDLSVAIDALKSDPDVVGSRVGVVGFCLGGSFVLNLAAARDDIAAVSYYGFPGGTPGGVRVNPAPMDQVDDLRSPVLAFWGDSDSSVPAEDIKRYIELQEAADSDVEIVVYPGMDHGFLSAVDPDSGEPVGAAADSWQRTVGFLEARTGG